MKNDSILQGNKLMDESKFLEIAKKAAKDAGKVILSYYGKKHTYFEKGESSNFATQADLEAEKIIIDIITKEFPDHNIIAEEKGQNNKGSRYTWVIDPLDGTIPFAAGMPFFAVSIGLLEENKPILGVLYWVVEDKLYYAQKEKGAYVNGQRLTVNQVDKLENAVIGIELGHFNSRKRKFDKCLNPIMYKCRYPYVLGSVAVELILVAQGALAAHLTDANVWDFIAGAIIVEEAGGRVTDLKGEEIDWTKQRLDLVASNGLIHEEILEALKEGNRQ